MANPAKGEPEDREPVEFEEVVRRLLAAPPEHLPRTPNGLPKKKAPRKRKRS
jgi:hypothetical protein